MISFPIIGGSYTHYDSGWIGEICALNFSCYYKHIGVEIPGVNGKWTNNYELFLLPTSMLFFAAGKAVIKDTIE